MSASLDRAPSIKVLLKKPTRPLTAYNLFFHDQRQLIQEEMLATTGNKAHFTEVTKIVGSRWRQLGQEDRLHYKKLAAKDKQRYAVELVEWKIQQEILGEQRQEATPVSAALRVQVPHHWQSHQAGNQREAELIQVQRSTKPPPPEEPSLVQKLQTLLTFMEQLKQKRRQSLPRVPARSQFPTYARTYEPIRNDMPPPTGNQGFNYDDVRFLEDTFNIHHHE